MPSLIGYDLVKELREMDPGHKYILNTNLHDYITLIHYHNLMLLCDNNIIEYYKYVSWIMYSIFNYTP